MPCLTQRLVYRTNVVLVENRTTLDSVRLRHVHQCERTALFRHVHFLCHWKNSVGSLKETSNSVEFWKFLSVWQNICLPLLAFLSGARLFSGWIWTIIWLLEVYDYNSWTTFSQKNEAPLFFSSTEETFASRHLFYGRCRSWKFHSQWGNDGIQFTSSQIMEFSARQRFGIWRQAFVGEIDLETFNCARIYDKFFARRRFWLLSEERQVMPCSSIRSTDVKVE